MAGPLRVALVGIALGASLVFAGICLAIALSFGDRDAGTGRPIVQNDFVAFQATAVFAARGRPELAYDRVEMLALERELARNPGLELLPGAYPPSFAWMLRPLGSLDIVTAYRIWAASTLGAAVLVALLIARRRWMLAVAPLMPAVAFCAAAGQNGNLSAALLGAGMWLLPGRPVAAGVAFGLMTYKPQLAVVLPFCLLAGGHLRTLASAAATAVTMTIAGIAAFGTAPLLAFLANLPMQAELLLGSASEGLWHRMPTVMVGALRLTGERGTAAALHALLAVGALTAVCRIWRNTDRRDVRALGMFASMPLVSPYFFAYDLAVALVPLAFIVAGSSPGMEWRRLFVVAALWMTAPILTYAPGALNWPVGPAIWGVLLMLAMMEARRGAPGRPASG